jgi:cephalosporin hydroxylase
MNATSIREVIKKPARRLPESVKGPLRVLVYPKSVERHIWSRLIREAIFHRRMYGLKTEREIIDAFHQLYYDSYLASGTWTRTRWMGIPVSKCPLDMWIYQEIFFDVRPDVVIECGTASGGCSLFLGQLCDLLDHGRVLTIDIDPVEGWHLPYSPYTYEPRPQHSRIDYFVGSTVDPRIAERMRREVDGAGAVLVILDSNHQKDHVLQELRIYGELVTTGSYIIVEDTNMNGHPVLPDYGPGPMEAVEEFLAERKDYRVDREREKFYMTQNPSGYLLRTE